MMARCPAHSDEYNLQCSLAPDHGGQHQGGYRGDQHPIGWPAADAVDHPAHYGGVDDPYEAIKVIEAWKLGFCLGNTVKYIARAELKGAPIEDLKKARWYLDREIAQRSL